MIIYFELAIVATTYTIHIDIYIYLILIILILINLILIILILINLILIVLILINLMLQSHTAGFLTGSIRYQNRIDPQNNQLVDGGHYQAEEAEAPA
jgi:hypothetical protein